MFKKYWVFIIYGFLTTLIVYTGMFFYQINIPTQSSLWARDLYQLKLNISETTSSPKLVIVSGSNSLMGISCKFIHKQTNINCFNGGSTAPLGIDYLLFASSKWLNAGDIVLLPLEYAHYNSNGEITELLIDYVVSRDFNYFISTNFVNKVRIFMGISFQRLITGINIRLNLNKYIIKYNKAENKVKLNQFGDLDTNLILESKMTTKQKKDLASLEPMENFGYVKNSSGMKSIKNFISFCRNNNITVLATWPNTMWFDIYKNNYQDQFQGIKDFYNRLQISVIGNPEDFMYDKSMFYDSIYHLNDRGVKQRTKELIELLEPYLESIKE